MRTLAIVLLAFAILPVQAQDLPGRVGRVAHIEGRASLYQDPDAGWEKAYVNSPVTSENSVWTDERSRAELRVSGLALRLDELTQVDLARLDDDEVDAFIPRGSVAIRVRHHASGERLVFGTPNARVRIRSDGRYRIDVDDERQETRVTVFAGEARIGTGEGRMRLGAGRSVLIFGSDPEFVEERARTDAFDRWVQARDERWREGRSRTYVSEYMTGYEDLDAYGAWHVEPDYGPLWFPSRVSATWAPYRYGHWSYVRPWGWTWIDDAPWGYAPFHYGRWVYVRNRWAWHPGERVARPAWAPALVGWIGGANFSVRVSSGAPVGWYPLSPWDRYEPWFNASPTYVNRVNVVVRGDRPAREDRRRWHEWTRERGTTVVDRAALVDRRPIAQAAIPVTMDAIRQAQAVNRPETILPSRSDFISRQRQQPQAVPAPTAPAATRQPVQPGAPVASQQPPGRSAVVRPDFGRRAEMDAPRPAANPPGRGPATAQPATRERREREVRDLVDREIRDAQQGGRERREAQERGQREQQQAQERAARDAAQQQQMQRQAQERAQREQQQAQERAQREQIQAQERAAREAAQQQQREQQQAQERAQREAAQQQQRQAQERAQREQQQAQERAAREAAQQQQRQAQERAQREQQQAQERAAREAAQRQQRQGQERAQREQQQAQERAAREAAQQQQQQQQQAQERAQREAQRQQRREDREKDKDKDEKEKGRSR